jgi:hypothetical protein
VLGHITPAPVANPQSNLQPWKYGNALSHLQSVLIDEDTSRAKKIPGRQPHEMEVE